MKDIKEIEHISDRAFSVRGRNMRELFENCARAIFGTQEPPRSGLVRTIHEVHAVGVDREALLVNWLNELLYLQERYQETFNNCEVLDLSDRTMRAKVSGMGGVGRKPVKAVTFHDLRIRPTGHGFWAILVVDV